MENLIAGLVIVVLGLLLWRLKGLPFNRLVRKEAFVLPPGVTMRSHPLLTDTDLVLYNLIRLAVQDQFLVFAKVPLWSIVNVEAEGKVRLYVLRQIALKQLDFVLVHPGTKLAEQVVLLEETPSQPAAVARRREIRSVLQAAGIALTTLKSRTSYTVPQLGKLLGTNEVE
ncbi:MAG: DUF2726 domain-containing protein [Nitrospira sp.]|nr:DUF2726 domain-containing protein [Nitrospira sp.]